MLRIVNHSGKYTVYCYSYDHVQNINTFVYSRSNLELSEAVYFLKGLVLPGAEEEVETVLNSERAPHQVFVSEAGKVTASIV